MLRLDSRMLIDRFGAWEGMVYRYLRPRYSTSAKLLSGDGAFKAGGRWNAPGSYHAVYCASSPELGHREYFAAFEAAGFPLHRALPLVGKAIRVRLMRVLDLRASKTLRRLNLTADELRNDPWREATERGEESLCQAVGRLAWEAGAQALLVVSASAYSADEFNVVLIRENIQPIEDFVHVMREGET